MVGSKLLGSQGTKLYHQHSVNTKPWVFLFFFPSLGFLQTKQERLNNDYKIEANAVNLDKINEIRNWEAEDDRTGGETRKTNILNKKPQQQKVTNIA